MKEHIVNWLTVGMQKSVNNLFEGFYYDKRDNEFFEIVVVDYFMLDENFNIAKDVSTSYSQNDHSIITDRIKRIEAKDRSIITVTRFGDTKNDSDLEFISNQIELFLTSNSIDFENSTIWEPEGGLEISVSTKVDGKKEIKKPWWKIW